MTFAEKITPLIKSHGTGKAAEICGVSPRTLQLWMRGEQVPNLATQAGALLLLSKTPNR